MNDLNDLNDAQRRVVQEWRRKETRVEELKSRILHHPSQGKRGVDETQRFLSTLDELTELELQTKLLGLR